MSNEEIEEEVYDLLTYILSSARVCVDEPKRYGSFRLFQSYKKLLEVMLRLNILKDKTLLKRQLEEIEKNKKAIASSSCVGTMDYLELLDRLIEMSLEKFRS